MLLDMTSKNKEVWAEVRASEMPVHVGEAVATLASKKGVKHAIETLQKTLTALKIPTKIDGIIGERTILGTMKYPNSKELAEEIKKNDHE
jgi:lysozyme family protein